jgi:hypothetical protein
VGVPLSNQDRVDIELQKLRDKKEQRNQQINALKEKVLELEKENAILSRLSELETPQVIQIEPKVSNGKSESAAVVVWSDWHNEELVLPGMVGGKNEFNLQIFDRRFEQLLQGTLAWLQIESSKTAIKSLTIALLGDFISGSIHEDLAESNLLSPVDAIYKVQGKIVSGLQFLLKHTASDMEIVVVCHSGNHGRFTKKQRIATETGNSLEQYMYYAIRDYFRNEPRLKFIVATGYHTFVHYFGGSYTVRYHHGHQINYQGGIGGITIPVNKAIAQWNKANQVNLDVFGHFHTKFDGGNFIANGSLIGYNAYAVSIKASYEKPSQTFFLINKEYNEKTMVAPIFLN